MTARACARGGGSAPKFQLLFYPVTQSTGTTQSREKFADGYVLTRESIGWHDGHYLPPDVDRYDERVSPLLSPPPRNLAPALVVTAGFDPLKDEGCDYAMQMNAAGVPCDHLDYADQIHGFVSFTAFSTLAEQAIADAAQAVHKAIA